MTHSGESRRQGFEDSVDREGATKTIGRGATEAVYKGGGSELYPIDVSDADEISWADRALCAQVDPEAFFPEKGGSTREAKKVCTGCEVTAECLKYALDNDERFGVWGGLTERERRRLKKATT